MGNVSVSGLAATWRGGSSECTDDSESWDCYLQNEPPCDASEITISTASSRSTSTCTQVRGIGFEPGRSTRATRAGKRSKMSKSLGTSTRNSTKPGLLLKVQEHLKDEIRQLRTELDSAKVLLGKQEGLEQRIVELERLTKLLQGGDSSQATVTDVAANHDELGAPLSPVYAVATESL